jgi:hypothetical protein
VSFFATIPASSKTRKVITITDWKERNEWGIIIGRERIEEKDRSETGEEEEEEGEEEEEEEEEGEGETTRRPNNNNNK